MIPYITLRVLHLGGIAIMPFAVLLTIAVLTGFALAVRHGRRYGIRREQIAELSVWMVGCGFVGATLFKLVYVPELLAAAIRTPGLSFRSFGISSFGGIFGGCLALLLFFRRRRLAPQARLAILDALGFAMP